MLVRVYVWEWPVRFTHWVNAISIIFLCVTGIYIGTPFLYAPPGESVMSIMRFLHFVAAYLFTASFWLRIYWFFVGNQYSRWADFIPLTQRQWKGILGDIKFYMFLDRDLHHRAGHHLLAAFTYLGLFFLFHLEIVTGFALASMSHHGWLYNFMLGGWYLPYIHAQTFRLIHHLIMWLVIVFVMFHIYIGWFIDIVEKNAGISSIFSGYKILDESEIHSDRSR